MKRLTLSSALLVALTGMPVAAAHAASPAVRAAIVVEPSTWTVLHAQNPHQVLPTASMIKMLNALVVMDAIAAGELGWETPVRISRAVSRVEGSQVYLSEGEVFTAGELMRAMMVKSANDAAAALAEAVAGSQQAFVERMRAKAKAMGLDETEVHTPHGLDSSETGVPEDRSSAWDLARMGAAVLDHPELRLMVGTRFTPFRPGELELFNPNRLLGRYPFATGIKTGFHPGAHFCLTASARREGMELIAVVIGAEHRLGRFQVAEQLLEEAFDRYQMVVPLLRGELLPERAPVAGGRWTAVPVRSAADVRLVLAKREQSPRVERLVALTPQPAPIDPGQPLGRVVVRLDGEVVAEVPAVAAAEVPRGGLLQLWSQRLRSMLLARLALITP